jgi:aryl-alcohol dehydrogenase-like predicted oxidoreductase
LIRAGQLGLAAATLRAPCAAAEDDLLARPIPNTGERLPVIGLGTYRTFNVGNDPTALAPLIRVTQLFFEHGGRVVDSSPRYGPSEAVFGDVLARLQPPESLFVATKVDADDRETGIRQMRESATNMGVDKIDLMQIHNLRGWRAQLPTLKEWKSHGEFRYIGISASHEDLYEEYERIMRSEPLDAIQINYSLGEQRSGERILPLAMDLGMAVFINRPFVAGKLFSSVAQRHLPAWAGEIDCTSWAQIFLKFVLSHPAVTVALQATADPDHLIDNLGAARGRMPDEALRRRMTELV